MTTPVTIKANGREVHADVSPDGSTMTFEHEGHPVTVPFRPGSRYEAEPLALSSVAARMGLTVSAPKPAPAPKPAVVERTKADRPRSVVEMIGQDRARTQLKVRVRGTALRGRHPGHILLSGGPGLGKTSLAALVAQETGGELIETIGSALKTTQLLADTLSKLSRERTDVLFIDEIHALTTTVEELLYTAMEDGRISVAGSGQDAAISTIKLPEFIVVGATTMPGKVSAPFRDRCSLKLELEYYTVEQLTAIIEHLAERQEVKIEPEAAHELARRSKGTARVAKNLFESATSYAFAMADTVDVPVRLEDVHAALELDEIDELGLDRAERALLDCLCRIQRGKPIGLEALAASVGQDNRTIEATELYLIRAELIRRTKGGRLPTVKAFEHLGIEPPAGLSLFAEVS